MQAEAGKELEDIGYDKSLLDSFLSRVFAIVVRCMARHSIVEVIKVKPPRITELKTITTKKS
jgi:hypothetical protein